MRSPTGASRSTCSGATLRTHDERKPRKPRADRARRPRALPPGVLPRRRLRDRRLGRLRPQILPSTDDGRSSASCPEGSAGNARSGGAEASARASRLLLLDKPRARRPSSTSARPASLSPTKTTFPMPARQPRVRGLVLQRAADAGSSREARLELRLLLLVPLRQEAALLRDARRSVEQGCDPGPQPDDQPLPGLREERDHEGGVPVRQAEPRVQSAFLQDTLQAPRQQGDGSRAGSPKGFYDSYQKRLAALTYPQVQKAIRQHVDAGGFRDGARER